MKTFEEKWTAWLDDQLSGRELSEFEASLPDKAAAQTEKAEAKKLGELLKRELSSQPLKNEEFFSHQLRERIVQESDDQHRERSRRSSASSWWTIPRLLWAGTASLACGADEEKWYLEEIRAGRPLITAATQDQFVPQMVNLEALGAVDFQKGCYPGQEIVARAQYRGQVKRRMVRLPAPPGARLQPGDAFNGGTVVDSAGGELLAVMPE